MKKSKKITAAVVAVLVVVAVLATGAAVAPAFRDPGPVVGRFAVVDTQEGPIAVDTATGETWIMSGGMWKAIPGCVENLAFFGKNNSFRISPFLNVETAAEYLEKKHASEQ